MKAPHPSSTHAISRTTELLSVARTSLRILQQHPETIALLAPDLQSLSANNLTLHHNTKPVNAAVEALDEATLTLNLLDSTLKTLSNLVKRRGATNDPTEEINQAMTSFHNYSKGILDVIQNSLPQSAVLSPYDDVIVRASSQRVKHYEMVANVLKTRVEKRVEEFKGIMAVRGHVIKDLTLRRQQLLNANKSKPKPPMATTMATTMAAPKSGGFRIGNGLAPVTMDRKAKSQLNSPLFTMSHTTSTKSIPPPPMMRNRNPNASGNGGAQSIAAPNPYNAPPAVGYGGASAGYGAASGGGYGGGYANGNGNNPYSSTNTGMRRRAGGAGGSANMSNNSNAYDPNQQDESENKIHDSNTVQAQIQMRRDNRQTQTRLESARQAEKTLAELTTMFSKMSNLIHSQGETLVKIEDDVEAAMDHVEAGNEELVKLYEWTSGNRGLIIKCFAILLFFIIFMRFYG